MLTSKQRAEKRAQANSLEPVFQVGKGGVSEALVAQTDSALTARELIKLKVLLESCPAKPREVADKLAQATGADVVQVIGGCIVFFRESPEKRKKEKEKLERKKELLRKAREKQRKEMSEKKARAKRYKVKYGGSS